MSRIPWTALVVLAVAATARAGTVKIADSVRNSELDKWAAYDVKFCRTVMDAVFKRAGLEVERTAFDESGMFSVSNAEVICSAFRTPALLKDYKFPLQPIGRMHFALYTTPSRAMSMMSVKITDWPKMRVGYSPVSQGQNDDREKYF